MAVLIKVITSQIVIFGDGVATSVTLPLSNLPFDKNNIQRQFLHNKFFKRICWANWAAIFNSQLFTLAIG